MTTVPEQLGQLTKDKTKLSEILSAKGIEASPSETFTTLVPKINNIKGICVSDATIQGGDVLDGKVAYNNEGRVVGYDRERNILIDSNAKNLMAVTNQEGRFCGCISEFKDPLDCSKLQYASRLFYGCVSLKKGPTLINTSQIKSFYQCFAYCRSLTVLPEIDTSGASDIVGLVHGCTNLRTLPALDCSNVTAITPGDRGHSYFGNNFFNDCGYITNLGGFINLGKAYSNTAEANKIAYCLYMGSRSNSGARMPYLTIDSMFNIANGLYDLNINGVAEQSIYLIDYCYNRLSYNTRWNELITLIESKGWKLVRYSG